MHSHLCTGIHKIPPMEFLLADDNTSSQAEHQGVIELRVLVDDALGEWTDLLIDRLELNCFKSLPEQVLQKLPPEIKLKLRKENRTQREKPIMDKKWNKVGEENERSFSINSVAMKSMAKMTFLPKEKMIDAEEQMERFNEKCRKLGLPRPGPAILHNPDKGDDHEPLENIVGGDVNVYEEADPKN
eukprot:snap_masked-scaffold_10-processed-gene-5.48-mRNA-1 protein AED:1.00 eAED:1.00 QI:0/0/0/0/1/1/2/0/185